MDVIRTLDLCIETVIDKPGVYLPESNETRPEEVEGGPQVQRIWIRGRAYVLLRNSQLN